MKYIGQSTPAITILGRHESHGAEPDLRMQGDPASGGNILFPSTIGGRFAFAHEKKKNRYKNKDRLVKEMKVEPPELQPSIQEKRVKKAKSPLKRYYKPDPPFPGPGSYELPPGISTSPKYTFGNRTDCGSGKEENPVGPGMYDPNPPVRLGKQISFNKERKRGLDFTAGKDQSNSPGPGSYEITKDKLDLPDFLRGNKGTFTGAERGEVNEIVGTDLGPKYDVKYDSLEYKQDKIRNMSVLTKKPKPEDSGNNLETEEDEDIKKIERLITPTESLPEDLRNVSLVLNNSPKWGFSKSKRVFISPTNRKEKSPGPGEYKLPDLFSAAKERHKLPNFFKKTRSQANIKELRKLSDSNKVWPNKSNMSGKTIDVSVQSKKAISPKQFMSRSRKCLITLKGRYPKRKKSTLDIGPGQYNLPDTLMKKPIPQRKVEAVEASRLGRKKSCDMLGPGEYEVAGEISNPKAGIKFGKAIRRFEWMTGDPEIETGPASYILKSTVPQLPPYENNIFVKAHKSKYTRK